MNSETLNGIFDSGVGGLSVLKRLIPYGGKYIYFADTKNLPYGDKTKEQIISYTRDIIKFFISKGAAKVFMACNTSSALAYDTLKSEFESEIKIFPLIQTAAPYIAKTAQKIGVIATQGTVKSQKYTQEILRVNPDAKVIEIPCPGLVPIVENGIYNLPESLKYIESCIKPLLDNNCKKIVLGCTHYPHLLPVLTKFAPRNTFIDPAEFIEIHAQKTNQAFEAEFFVTSDANKFVSNAKLFMDINSPVHLLQNVCA